VEKVAESAGEGAVTENVDESAALDAAFAGWGRC
jgi:hypothetical protein